MKPFAKQSLSRSNVAKRTPYRGLPKSAQVRLHDGNPIFALHSVENLWRGKPGSLRILNGTGRPAACESFRKCKNVANLGRDRHVIAGAIQALLRFKERGPAS
ncbi:hypothetical protein D1O30_02475 [Methylocystis hirsuta]|uniref:Uncharacterized protein n=1 Tax=Methylocystis hirsuta TaxID=369798 RepID=A0A3M9XL31_9HYPH|nr:hypothetical protein D1O30_02475 [Methylocystis hirsuta]